MVKVANDDVRIDGDLTSPEQAAAVSGVPLRVVTELPSARRAVVQASREGPIGPLRRHRHLWAVHQHSGLPAHVHIGGWTLAQRPLLVGAVHGLAGSGALTALVMTTLPTTSAQFIYMALFGLGSTVGMAALSGLLGWPLARLGANPRVGRGLSMIVGTLSAVLGIVWGYPLASRLF